MSVRLLISMLVLAGACGSAVGSSAFVPNHRPTLTVTPRDGDITIDGNLDDAGWRRAAHADNFSETEPGDQVRPPVSTEVLVTYDRDRLYIAFIAEDSPSRIRSSLRDRDEIFDEDYVGVVIDTYDNASWAYQVYANPLGVQGDMRWTPDGEDVGFDLVFESRGRITDDGYQVEMAIPFKSLRFPDRDEQRWRATFVRIHPRDSRRKYSWASIDRDEPCYPCQFGVIDGLRNVKPGTSLEALPSVFGSQSSQLNDPSDPNSGFDVPNGEVEGGMSIRYGFSSSLSAEMSVNPDFSQVESDAAQIDVNTTFALFYPERRPFFQEGSDLYNSFFDVIYTRMINDPAVAGKLTLRSDNTSFVYLTAYDENTPLIIPLEERSVAAAPGESYSNIARVRHSFGDENFVGAVITDRRYRGGGSGTVAGVDGLVRFAQNYRIQAQVLGSYVDEPNDTSLTPGLDGEEFDNGNLTVALDGQTFGGGAGYVALGRDARRWNSDLSWWEVRPTFRADNGFVTRNSERQAVWYNNAVFYPNNRWLDRIRGNNKVTRRWNGFGSLRAFAVENWIDVLLKRQTSVSLGFDLYDEIFRGVNFQNMPLYYGEIVTAFSDPVRAGVWVGVGDRIARAPMDDQGNLLPPVLGDGVHVDLFGTIKLGQQVVVEPTLAFSNLYRKDNGAEIFEGYVLRTRVSYQITRELFLRLVLQQDDFYGQFDVEPLVSYKLNPFTIFYIGGSTSYLDYDHRSLDPAMRTGDGFEPSQWQWFFKLQYLYRV